MKSMYDQYFVHSTWCHLRKVCTLSTDYISYNKFATQSHTLLGSGYDASNAVDGNTETCMRTRDIGYNSPEKTVWWKVDLGRVYNIYSINILFKNYNTYGEFYYDMYKSV